MMAKEKYRPRVGDVRWVVSWVDKLTFDECGDLDRDNCRERRRLFETKAEAERYAREVYPRTVGVFGFVEYWPIQFVSYDGETSCGCWKDIADAECYDGED